MEAPSLLVADRTVSIEDNILFGSDLLVNKRTNFFEDWLGSVGLELFTVD